MSSTAGEPDKKRMARVARDMRAVAMTGCHTDPRAGYNKYMRLCTREDKRTRCTLIFCRHYYHAPGTRHWHLSLSRHLGFSIAPWDILWTDLFYGGENMKHHVVAHTGPRGAAHMRLFVEDDWKTPAALPDGIDGKLFFDWWQAQGARP